MNATRVVTVVFICCLSLIACKPPATTTYVVKTAEVAATLAILNSDLDRLYSGTAFAYMAPEDREEMHRLISQIYEIRSSLGTDINVASAAELVTFILDGNQATKLGCLRESIVDAMDMAGAYRPSMNEDQQSRFDKIQTMLSDVDRRMMLMHELVDSSANTQAVVGMLNLAAAIARSRQ